MTAQMVTRLTLRSFKHKKRSLYYLQETRVVGWVQSRAIPTFGGRKISKLIKLGFLVVPISFPLASWATLISWTDENAILDKAKKKKLCCHQGPT